jgi:hypothetical protein
MSTCEVMLCVPKNLFHSLGLVYKSMRGMMTNSIDRDQWLNVTSESRDRIQAIFFLFLNFALGRNRTRYPRVIIIIFIDDLLNRQSPLIESG